MILYPSFHVGSEGKNKDSQSPLKQARALSLGHLTWVFAPLSPLTYGQFIVVSELFHKVINHQTRCDMDCHLPGRILEWLLKKQSQKEKYIYRAISLIK